MVISIKKYENSSTYKFIKDVIEITNPLSKLGVKYFIYAELKGYYISCLVNNDRVIRDFIKHNGLKYELALSPHKIINNGLYLVSALNKPKEINNYYELFFKASGTSDEIVYIIDDIEVRKVYIFGISDLFGINKEYLQLFILYFNDRASYLINTSDAIKIPRELIEYNTALDVTIKHFLMREIEEDFLISINAKHYKIKQLQQQYFLSLREVQCLELILEDKIAKEIADFLNLTTRTVETYIDNLRKKLNCRSKHEIIVKFFIKFKK